MFIYKYIQGQTDVNGQQLNLRASNSWLLKIHEVSIHLYVDTSLYICLSIYMNR